MGKKYKWLNDDGSIPERNQTGTADQSQEQTQTKKKYKWLNENDITDYLQKEITSRLSNWSNGYNSYLSDYSNRFSNRKGTYEDAYVSDSADYLEKATQRKSELDTEADSLLDYIYGNKDRLDSNYVQLLTNSLYNARRNEEKIVKGATADNEYWTGFGSEDLLKDHGTAENAYKYFQRSDGYFKKYDGMTAKELKQASKMLDDSEEKNWLDSYISSVDYEEKSNYNFDEGDSRISNLETELKALQDYYDNAQESLLDYTGDPEEYDRKATELYGQYGGDHSGLLSLINEKQQELDEEKQYRESAKGIQEKNSWDSVTQNQDFYKYSQYSDNPGGSWQGQNRYNTVNAIGANDNARGYDNADHLLTKMTGDEVAVYNYYYATQGEEKAQEYLDLLSDTLKARQNSDMVTRLQSYTEDMPVLANIASVGMSLGSGVEYALDSLGYGLNKLTGQDARMDTNTMALAASTIRGTTAQKLSWKIGDWDAGSFLYNNLMSGIDSVASATFGQYGGLVLGLSAAANGVNDALERGMTDEAAFWNGLYSGIFECLFESVSIGNFNALKEVSPESVKDIAKNLAKSMLVNASEETFTEIANIAYDTLANGEFANYTLEDLKSGAWKDALGQVAEAGAGGALMGLGLGALGQAEGYAANKRADRNAYKKYGGNPGKLIQEALGNDAKSESYKLGKEYQAKIDSGAELTGREIRNLLAANEEQNTAKRRQAFKESAEKRLTELGQTEDASKTAELVTRYATGEQLTRSEKSALARSQYGAQVAKEFRDAIQTANAQATNAQADKARSDASEYEVLENRVEHSYPVAESGQTTVHSTGESVDLGKVEVTNIGKDNMTLSADGKEVTADEIDYADDSEAFLMAAVPKIENITPAAATVFINGYASSNGQTVGAYLNGIDEAYTYGYWGYSEADMKAGKYTQNLTAEQAKGAYLLGQSARRIGIEQQNTYKKMRTAAQAEKDAKATVSKEEKVAQQEKRFESDDTEVYYMDGNDVVKFDKHTGKYDAKRMAAVNAAKFLSKMNLGGKYYFFESYMNADGERAYKDANGAEKTAPNGIYSESDGSIYIDLNAGNDGRGVALFTLGHEVTHFIEQWNKAKYKILSDFLIDAYRNTDMTMHERVLEKQAWMSDNRNGEAVSYGEAFSEVVADAMSTMFSDGNLYEKLAELKVKDEGLFNKIRQFINNVIAKFREVYAKLSPDQKDAIDIREMKDVFDHIQTAFAEALVEASDNFHAAESSTDGGATMLSLRGTNKDGIEVYETSEEIKKLPYKERRQRFLEIMKNEYRGRTAKFIRNGHVYYATFAESDVNKNIYGDKLSDPKGWKAKINVGADGNIFELVENAKYNGSLSEQGKKIGAHKGVGYWDYFIKTVQVDDNVFDLVANVRKKSDGAYVYSIQLNQNKTIEASPPLGSLLRPLLGVTNTSENNVPQKSADVNTKFQLREPVEYTRDLVALHNLTEDKLEKSLKLGGFPMPSIAVTRSDIPHTNFGDITLVFGKETIDPKARKKNTVYSADAWTPTFPQVEYEADRNVSAQISKKYYDIAKQYGYDFASPLYSSANYVEDVLNRYGGEQGIIEHFADNTDML